MMISPTKFFSLSAVVVSKPFKLREPISKSVITSFGLKQAQLLILSNAVINSDPEKKYEIFLSFTPSAAKNDL
jgi:hypothetical protein